MKKLTVRVLWKVAWERPHEKFFETENRVARKTRRCSLQSEGFLFRASNNPESTASTTEFPDSSDTQRPVDTSLQISITVAYCAIFISSLIGNAITVYIVSTKSYLKSITNCLIANMAIADLLTTLFAMPYSVLYVFVGSHWIGGAAGKLTCKLVHFVVALSIAASITTLMAIALDRFYAIVYPFKRGIEIRKIRVIRVAIWSFLAIFMSPYLYFHTVQELPNGNAAQCVVKWEPLADSFESSQIYFVVIFISLYGVPLIIITALYVIICRKLWLRKLPGNPSMSARRNADLSKRRTIKILIVLVVAFALCWFPTHTMHYFIFYHYKLYQTFSPYLVLFAFWVSHANSCINPFLYITLNKNFRRAFWDVFLRSPSRSDSPVRLNAAISMNYLTADVSLKRGHARLWAGGRDKYEPSKGETEGDRVNSFSVDLLSVAQPVTSSESSL